MIRRAIFAVLSRLLPYRRPDIGWLNIGIIMRRNTDNTVRRP